VRKIYLDRNLQVMGGVWVMVILGVSSIMPVLPTVMRELNVPARSIGLVIAVFTLPGVLLAPVVGILADRFGRKRILVISLLVFGIFGGACAFARDFETLLLLRFFQGLGVAPVGVLNPTIVADLYGGHERTTAMGYSGLVISTGTAIFPLAGGSLALWGWQYPFLLPLLALPVAAAVHLILENPEPKETIAFKDYLRGTVSLIRTRQVIGLFILTFLTHIILFGPINTYLPVLLKADFNASPAAIGMLVSISSLLTAATSSQVGRLSRRFSELPVLRVAFILHICSMAVIPQLTGFWMFVIAIGLFGAGMGFSAPVRVSILTGLAPMGNRASIMAVNGMILRLGQTVSPVLMGAVLSGFGIRAVFWVGAAVAMTMLLISFWALELHPVNREDKE
jgi:MFS family permease